MRKSLLHPDSVLSAAVLRYSVEVSGPSPLLRYPFLLPAAPRIFFSDVFGGL